MSHAHTISAAHGPLSTFSLYAETTSLAVLRAVEETVDALVRYEGDADCIIEQAREMRGLLEDSTGPIDPEDKIADHLASAEATIEDAVDSFKHKREAAFKDPKLNGHHEESVAASYERAIDRFCTAHELLTQLRWLIMEHDADHDNVILGSYEDPEDLIAELDRD